MSEKGKFFHFKKKIPENEEEKENRKERERNTTRQRKKMEYEETGMNEQSSKQRMRALSTNRNNFVVPV